MARYDKLRTMCFRFYISISIPTFDVMTVSPIVMKVRITSAILIIAKHINFIIAMHGKFPYLTKLIIKKDLELIILLMF